MTGKMLHIVANKSDLTSHRISSTANGEAVGRSRAKFHSHCGPEKRFGNSGEKKKFRKYSFTMLHGCCCPLIREAGRLILYTYTIVLYASIHITQVYGIHDIDCYPFGVLDAFKHCIAMVR